MSNFDDVGDFHKKFNLPVADDVYYERNLDGDLLAFRIKFMQEELDEFIYCAADDDRDYAGMFDALLDLVYVAMGTAHMLNYPWQKGWDAVQRANMAKVRAQSADESKRGSAWDVVKPEGWTAPDIAAILRDHAQS